MKIKYLFNSSGEFIAYRSGNYLFDSKNNWIGWLPWNDNEVVNQMGEYLATIYNDRLFEFSRREIKNHPGFTSFPGHPGYIEDPGYGGSTSVPPFAQDVNI